MSNPNPDPNKKKESLRSTAPSGQKSSGSQSAASESAGRASSQGTGSFEGSSLPARNVNLDEGANINLVVNRPVDDEVTIDLVQVFHNMKAARRLYAWVLVLCLVVGTCVPLVMYQIKKKPLTVFSVVTLSYQVQNKDKEDDTYPVTDLTAPDGSSLNLGEITSAYVLQNALNHIELSGPVSVSDLRSRISIQPILSEESSRQREILKSMLENKSGEAYEQMSALRDTYTNSFVVSLQNSFGEDKLELETNELRLLLDEVLTAYNEYLVKTYSDKQLPEDAISFINIEEQDFPESVDQYRQALNLLYDYCDALPDNVQDYRSWKTGYSLKDLMAYIETTLEVDVEYLSSYVFLHGIGKDMDNTIDNYRYNLLVAQTERDRILQEIDATELVLKNYKNDEILVYTPDSEEAQTARTNTLYYNNLLLEQADNEQEASEKELEIQDIETRIAAMESARESITETERKNVMDELQHLSALCGEINQKIRNQMEEIFDSTFYNSLALHSMAMGKSENFLTTNIKPILIGAAAGALIGLCIWFFAGLAPEFAKQKKEQEEVKEA